MFFRRKLSKNQKLNVIRRSIDKLGKELDVYYICSVVRDEMKKETGFYYSPSTLDRYFPELSKFIYTKGVELNKNYNKGDAWRKPSSIPYHKEFVEYKRDELRKFYVDLKHSDSAHIAPPPLCRRHARINAEFYKFGFTIKHIVDGHS